MFVIFVNASEDSVVLVLEGNSTDESPLSRTPGGLGGCSAL
jgi:hypothetical protein